MKSNYRKKQSKSRHIPGGDAAGVRMTPHEFEIAKAQIGSKPRKQLAWIMRFAQQDPAQLSVGELLDERAKLAAFMHYEGWDNEYESFQLPNCPFVEHVRTDIAEILQPINTGKFHSFTLELDYYIYWPDKDQPPRIRVTDETSGAVRKFIDLFLEFRNELRRCSDPKCQHWFVGPANKEFCCTVCLSRTTTERMRKGGK